jgi:hypothetical protein
VPQQHSRSGRPRLVTMQRPYDSSGPSTSSFSNTSSRWALSSVGVLSCVMWIVLRFHIAPSASIQFLPRITSSAAE